MSEPGHLKALYRAGRAHYALRQYQLAGESFRAALSADAGQQEAKKELARCEARLTEEKEGIDVYRLYVSEKRQLGVDAAEFRGSIEVVTIPGKGRGVLATKEIPAGTQILVCKALQVGVELFVFAMHMTRRMHVLPGMFWDLILIPAEDLYIKFYALYNSSTLRVMRQNWSHQLIRKHPSTAWVLMELIPEKFKTRRKVGRYGICYRRQRPLKMFIWKICYRVKERNGNFNIGFGNFQNAFY